MYYLAKDNEFSSEQRDGSILIPDDVCFALLSQKQNGGTILPDANGNPVYVPPTAPAPADQVIVLQSQIARIEGATLMNRAVREFLILLAEQQAAAAGLTLAQLYAANIGYAKMKDVDNAIVALRAQIVSLGG